MRRSWALVGVFLCGCASRSGSSPRAMCSSDSRGNPPQLWVMGSGEVVAKPDLVVITVGAEIVDDKASVAQSKVNEIIARLVTSLRSAGVTDKDVQTSQISIGPNYVGNNNRKFSGFIAINILEVHVADLSKAGPVLDAAIASGANRIDSVDPELKDDHDQRLAATRLAAQDAQSRASSLAAAMGVKIVGIASVSEQGASMPQQSLFGGGGESATTAAPDITTTVIGGEVHVQASVNVSYRIARGN